MRRSRFLLSLSVLAILATGDCKGRGADPAKSRSPGGGPTTGPTPGGDMEPGSRPRRVAGGRLEVAFTGFGQTADAKQRVIRYMLTNNTKQGIRSVRLRFGYFGRDRKPLGVFPLQVVRPAGKFGGGVTLRESFELLGQTGPPEEVTDVVIAVERVTFEDGSRWP